jgi:hypothetical protein
VKGSLSSQAVPVVLARDDCNRRRHEYTEMSDGLSLIRALAATPSLGSASQMLFGFQ